MTNTTLEAEKTETVEAPVEAPASVPENVDSPVTLSDGEQDTLLTTAAAEAERPKVDAPGTSNDARAWSQSAPQEQINLD